MDAGQALLKITSVLPDTRASWGQRGTIHPGAAAMEKSEVGVGRGGVAGAGGGGGKLWCFFLDPPSQQIKLPVLSQQC